MILDNINNNLLEDIKPSSSTKVFSHHQFVDDTILGGMTSIKEDTILKEYSNRHYKALGYLINWDKSALLFINTP